MMIDFLKIRTFSQSEIIRLRGLELVPDYPIQGWETYKISDRIKFRFKPLYESGEFIGYAFADLSIQPHFIFNGGIHNGNDFSPSDCINTLNKIFKDLGIQDLSEFQIIGIEFGVNVIPQTDIKEIINSIKYWKRKPFRRNKADFSLITDSTAHKQIKAYAKGIDAKERLKTDEVHPNTFRFEIRIKKQQQIKFSIWKSKGSQGKFTAKELFETSTYQRFKELIIQDLGYTLFLTKPKKIEGLTSQEKKDIKQLSNPIRWTAYLQDQNRDKFNYNRKKYERIIAKIPNIKTEIKEQIEAKFKEWGNPAILPNNNKQEQTCKSQIINKLTKNNSAILPSHAHTHAFYRVEFQKK